MFSVRLPHRRPAVGGILGRILILKVQFHISGTVERRFPRIEQPGKIDCPGLAIRTGAAAYA